jgi:hypothetical protein
MKKVIVILVVIALALPLSALVALAQPMSGDNAPRSLNPSQVNLGDDLAAALWINTFSVVQRPDLTLSSGDIKFAPSSPTTRDAMTIQATIRNAGSTTATHVVVRFYGDGGTIGDKTISSINAGQSKTTSVGWGPLAKGPHQVRVEVDPQNRIAESNEGNNAASAGITVVSPSTPPQVSSSTLPQSPPPTLEDKWAVVIGISDYQGTANDLWNPDKDAMDMQQALITKYGFPRDNIKMLLNSQATYQAILGAINWLAGVEDSSSTVVFLFSGHGFRAPDSRGLDTDREVDGYDEGIVSYDMYNLPDGLLRQKFSAFETKNFALIFCSCYSGGMFDDPNVDLGAPGRIICSACKTNQLGWDYLRLANTLFGYYFIDEGILQGKADGATLAGVETSGVKDGQVSIEEALAYAYPRVTVMQPQSQPQIYDGFAGEFVP